jgi:hypothetical protein
MWEDVFQIYRRFGDSDADLIASDLSLSDAIIFIEAWMLKNYADEVSSLEIRRQPMDYGVKTND